jgi:hypothetical protein
MVRVKGLGAKVNQSRFDRLGFFASSMRFGVADLP